MNEVSKERIMIETINLSYRTTNVLTWAGIVFIDELENTTAQELISIRGCGMKSLREIRKELARYGKCLKGDYIANNENDKKIIENIPKVIAEIQKEVRNLERSVKILYETLEQLHLNLQPSNNRFTT